MAARSAPPARLRVAVTGPTGTNLMDLYLGILGSPGRGALRTDRS